MKHVMEHFPAVLTREESDALADLIDLHFRNRHGYGLWAVEIPGCGDVCGFHRVVDAGLYCALHGRVWRDRMAAGYRALEPWVRGWKGATGGVGRFAFDEPEP